MNSTESLIANFTKSLTCTNSISTFVHDQGSLGVDATARKLVERMKYLEYERRRIQGELESIRTALSVAGIKPGRIKGLMDMNEANYVNKQIFSNMSLRESCETILQDHRGEWLSKSEIEYLIVRGGYNFTTKDSKNSVGVTLQRMKEEGRCEVERVRGTRGNRYRWPVEVKGEKNAASTNDSRK